MVYGEPALLHAAKYTTPQPVSRVRYPPQSKTDRGKILSLYIVELGIISNLVQLQALRDLYLIHKSVELDEYRVTPSEIEHAGPFQANAGHAKAGLTYASQCRTALSCCSRQYALLFTKTKLKNAVLSTCVVALAQQLCGSKHLQAL